MRPKHKQVITATFVATLILLFSFLIRIHRIGSVPLSGDEAFSAVEWGNATLQNLLTKIAVKDPQPLGALLSFKLWMVATGTSETTLRLLSALMSTLIVASTYRLTKNIAPPKTALFAMILVSLNPFQVWYSQDFRPYALWMAFSAITMVSLHTIIHNTKYRSRSLMLYVAFQTLALYSFYFEAFFWVTTNLYILVQKRFNFKRLIPWFIAQLAITSLIAPWYLQPFLRNSSYHPTAGLPDIPATYFALFFGETNHPEPIIMTAVTAFLLSAAIFFAVRVPRSSRSSYLFLLFQAFIPVAMLALLTLLTQRGFYRPRYIAPVAFPLLVLFSILIPRFASIKQFIRPILLIVITTLFLIADIHYFYDTSQRKAPDWRVLMTTLNRLSGDDYIIQNYPDPAFSYYYKGPAPTTILPNSPITHPDTTREQVSAILTTSDYVWFIPIESDAWDRNQIVSNTLQTQAQPIRDFFADEFHLYQYADWSVTSFSVPPRGHETFPQIATLLGSRLAPPDAPLQPDTQLTIELYWSPLKTTARPLTVFMHLDGPAHPDGSTLYAQDDHPPQNSPTLTTTWQLNHPIRDIYSLTIPTTAPPGDYQISIGFYDPLTGQRFLNQHNADTTIILTFTINSPTK